MSGLFAGLLRTRRALSHRVGVMSQHRYNISSKPPKDNIGPGQSMFVLTVMAVTILGPSGWILSHLDEYKSRG